MKTLSRADDKAEGRAAGLAEGKAEAKLETARSLKSLAVDVATISKATGLPVDEIEAL